MKHFRLMFLLLFTAQLGGCVGFGAMSLGKISDEHPSPQGTTFDLVQKYGLPTEYRCKSNGRETWVYRDDETRWSGVVLFAVLPIPLLVPTGSNGIDFEIENGAIVKSVYHRYSNGLFCGAFVYLLPGMTSSKPATGSFTVCEGNKSKAYDFFHQTRFERPKSASEPVRDSKGMLTLCSGP